MKRYYNSTTSEWYTEGNSMTRTINGTMFIGIPTAEQLSRFGFTEWTDAALTDEELLERAKQIKLSELYEYDYSTNVNGFNIIINGETITSWVDRETRADYKASIEAAELLGITEVHPVFNGITLTLDVQTAQTALAQIQIYANRCFNVTEQHRAAIEALSTIQEVEEYNFHTGYPEKLTFEI